MFKDKVTGIILTTNSDFMKTTYRSLPDRYEEIKEVKKEEKQEVKVLKKSSKKEEE